MNKYEKAMLIIALLSLAVAVLQLLVSLFI